MSDHRICHSSLSNRIMVARFGKNPNVALSTRDATSEFFQAIVLYAFQGHMPLPGKIAEFSFGGGDEQFTVIVTRKEATQ